MSALVALVAVLKYTRVLVQADTTLFTVLNVSDSAALFKTDKLSLYMCRYIDGACVNKAVCRVRVRGRLGSSAIADRDVKYVFWIN